MNGFGIIGPTFEYNGGIEYQMVLYPNGSNQKSAGFAECFFRIKKKSFDQNGISEMTIYFECGCIETQSEYRNVSVFSVDHLWSNWYPFNMRTVDIEQHIDDGITVHSFIDVLDIKYAENTNLSVNRIEHNQDIQMMNKQKYKWTMNGSMTKKMVFYEHNKRFYSEKEFEDGCWCLFSTQNTNKFYFHLYLRLIRLPPMVESVDVLCHLKSNVNATKHALSASLDYKRNSFTLCVIKPSVLITLDHLEFDLVIQVRGVYGPHRTKIDRKYWKKYGIVSKNKIYHQNTKMTKWKTIKRKWKR